MAIGHNVESRKSVRNVPFVLLQDDMISGGHGSQCSSLLLPRRPQASCRDIQWRHDRDTIIGGAVSSFAPAPSMAWHGMATGLADSTEIHVRTSTSSRSGASGNLVSAIFDNSLHGTRLSASIRAQPLDENLNHEYTRLKYGTRC